jgi:hypothetical protein
VTIKGTCGNCGKEFLLEQVIAGAGRCPWCGFVFQAHYTANLMRALQQANAAGDVLEDALRQVAEYKPAFELDDESILEPIRDTLRAQQRLRSRV